MGYSACLGSQAGPIVGARNCSPVSPWVSQGGLELGCANGKGFWRVCLGSRLEAKVRIPVWISVAVRLLRDSKLFVAPGVPTATGRALSSSKLYLTRSSPGSSCDDSLSCGRLVNGASHRAVTCNRGK